jgi:REP element-mobilizing transposase RayT
MKEAFRKRPKQTEMVLIPAGRGGWRPGAGRKARPGARVLHRRREQIPGHCPVHVTVRLQRGLPNLRQKRFVGAFKQSLKQCSERPGFRVIHYSIQKNHLHFLIEAQGKLALACGMKSLSARVARCVNRVFSRRGSVLDGRYHHRLLRTPKQVRNALCYVLLNARHHYFERHGRPPPEVRLDPASSAASFDGWQRSVAATGDSHLRATAPGFIGRRTALTTEVARARSWLLTGGWRRHRLIDPAEIPGA